MRGKREYGVDYQERWAKIKEEKVLIDAELEHRVTLCFGNPPYNIKHRPSPGG